MNSTSCVVGISITVVAGVVTWILVIPINDNIQENANGTLSASKVTTEAWITYYGMENGTVLVFNPANKSLSRQQFFLLDAEIYIIATAQNDNFGAILGFSDLQTVTNIYTFDKQWQTIIKSKDISNELGNEFGLSGINAVTFTYPTIGECQKMTMMSTLNNEDVQSDMSTNTCRMEPYCIASMNSGDIYIFGGLSTTNQHMLDSEKYSAESGSFVAVADFPVFLNQSSSSPPYCIATEYNENVIVCDNNRLYNQSCYIYNTVRDNWETVGGFKTDRSRYILIVLGGDLFAIGENQMKSIERFIPERKAWEIFMTDIDDTYGPFFAFSV